MPESSHEQNMGYLTQILALQEWTQENLASIKELQSCTDFSAVSAELFHRSYAKLGTNLELLLDIVKKQVELNEALESELNRLKQSQD